MHKTGSPVLPHRRDSNKSCWSTPASTPRRRRDGAKKGTPPGQQHTLKHTHSRVYATPTLSHTLRLTAPIYSNFEGGRRGATYTTGGEEGRDLYLTYYDEGAAAEYILFLFWPYDVPTPMAPICLF